LIASEPEDWVSAFESLQSADFRDQLRTAGRELVRTRYDWEIIGQSLARVYEAWTSPRDGGATT